MKKKFLFLVCFLIAISLAGCGKSKSILNFPSGKTEAKTGDYVLVAMPNEIEKAIQEWKEITKKGSQKLDGPFIHYGIKTMVLPGSTESTIGTLKFEKSATITIPNAFIIPLKHDREAKVGDVILTAYVGYTSLKRAIVTEGGESPKIEYLESAQKSEEEIPLGAFSILAHDWQLGTTLACRTTDHRYHRFTLLNIFENNLLVEDVYHAAQWLDKKDCIPVPNVPDVKVGDTVYGALFGNTFEKVEVTKVDKVRGIIMAIFEYAGGVRKEETFKYGDIMPIKSLK